MKLEINKAQLAIIFEALAYQGEEEMSRMLKSMSEGYTEQEMPISANELQVHYNILVEQVSEVVESEDWNWENNNKTIDCCHDENGDEF